MHKEADLLNRKSDVRTRECQVLECTCEAPIKSGIRDRVAAISGELLFGVNWSEAGIAVGHVCTV